MADVSAGLRLGEWPDRGSYVVGEAVMIKVTSSIKDFGPSMVRARYVSAPLGCGIDGMRWCEVGDDRWHDLRQGTCNPSDLPVDVMDAALDRRIAGVWPFYVEWPL